MLDARQRLLAHRCSSLSLFNVFPAFAMPSHIDGFRSAPCTRKGTLYLSCGQQKLATSRRAKPRVSASHPGRVGSLPEPDRAVQWASCKALTHLSACGTLS